MASAQWLSLFESPARSARIASSGWLDRAWVKWALILLSATTVLAVMFTLHLYFGCTRVRRPITWAQAARVTFTAWYFWAALAPGIAWLARRFSLDGPLWMRSVAVHLVAGIACACAKVQVDAALDRLAGTAPTGSTILAYQLDFLIYGAIVGISLAIHYYRCYRVYQEQALRASQLEARLALAQLQVLKMQLHPHFLFNTLHAISALVYSQPAAAERMISRLGDLLRFAVESVDVQEISLRREVELLNTYLDIERMRFGDRLQVSLDVDARTCNARVPSLVLQPLVENAIQHGVSPRARGGSVALRARLEAEAVEIEIEDDGVGLRNARLRAKRDGVGLANTRARLQNLYGDRYRLELCEASPAGVLVKLTIPYCPVEKVDA